jgi:hypothetical protein
VSTTRVSEARPHLAGELDAVGPGHHQVDDRDIDRAVAQRREGRRGVLGGDDLEALEPKPDRQHARMVRFVVDDENLGHDCSPNRQPLKSTPPGGASRQGGEIFGTEPGCPSVRCPLRAWTDT